MDSNNIFHREKSFTLKLVVGLGLLAVLLLSCKQSPAQEISTINVGDGGFLSERPCGPPCFWGIVPNVTTKSEVEKILESKNIVQDCRNYHRKEGGEIRGISCAGIHVSFHINDDRVEDVGFRPTQTITVEQVIEKYGEPTAIHIATLGIAELPNITVSLIYDEQRMMLILPEQDGIIFYLKPSTEVENISYFDLSSYQQLINVIQPHNWQGYGEYK